MASPYQWFAMRATYKREFVAQNYLTGKGLDVYIPMKREVRVVRGVKKKVTVPAIGSLIFVYAQKEALQEAKFGVEYLQYLTHKVEGRNVPIIVPTDQMEQFRNIADDDTIDKTFFAPGELNMAKGTKVRVHGGPLDGKVGVMLKIKGKRAKQFTIDLPGVVSCSTEVNVYDLIEIV